MAINLWTLGGLSKDILPIPSTKSQLWIENISSYILTFSARTTNNATLRVAIEGVSNTDYALTSEYKTITREFTTYKRGRLTFEDLGISYESKSPSIYIKDIVLVEKPTGNATINGIDGFLSGKWTFNQPEFKVISDDEIQITTNSSQAGARALITVDVEPFQKYTLQYEGANNNHRIKAFGNDWTNLASLPTGGTFTNGNYTKIFITLENQVAETGGTFIYRKPMIYKGTSTYGIIPYSKCTGTRMVTPLSTKNLIPNYTSFWEEGAGQSELPSPDPTRIRARKISLERNKDYTVTMNPNYEAYYFGYSTGSNALISQAPSWTSSFTLSMLNIDDVRIIVRRKDVKNISISEVSNLKLQIEEGLMATEFEDFKFKTGKNLELVPNKNLLPTVSSGWVGKGNFSGANGGTYDALDRISPKDRLIDVISGKTYTLSMGADYQGIILDGAISSPTYVNPLTFVPVEKKIRVTIKRVDSGNISPSDIDKVKPMLTEGSVQLPFAPYELSNKTVEKGMQFGGNTSNLSIFNLAINTRAVFEATFKSNVKNSIHQMIIDQYNPNVMTGNNGYGYAVFLMGDTGLLGFRYGRLSRTFTPPYDLRDGVKHSIKIVKDGLSLTAVIDGKEVWNETLAEQFYASDNNAEETTIGNRRGNIAEMYFKGIIYDVKVTNLETGRIHYYDLSKGLENGIVNSIDSENLIPDFDSGLWTRIGNATVQTLGKDYIRLTQTISQDGYGTIVPVESGQQYMISLGASGTVNGRLRVAKSDIASNGYGTFIANVGSTYATITIPDGVTEVQISLLDTGSFGVIDFWKPSLVKISNSFATIANTSNSPLPLAKPTKRQLFTKR